MADRISDLTRLQGHIRTLIALRKRQAKAAGKEWSDMSPKQAQKASADASWLGMDIDKAEREAHAAAVDCGLADPRSPDSYATVDYHPSGFHHYQYTPRKPRCMEAAHG